VSTDYRTTPGTPAGVSRGAAPTRDPDEIRREIERTQADLSSDVDALTEKVSPGRIVERRARRVRGSAARWKDRIMGTVMGSEPGTGTRGTARRAAASVSETASATAERVSDTMSGAAETATDAVTEAPQAVRRQTEGNPLAAGLIAFGAGWLVSSLLPASRQEQEFAGRAAERAGELGRPAAEAAKQAAVEMKDELAQPAQEAVESVRATATEAGRTVADEGRAATGQVQGQAQESADTVRRTAGPS
jgi:Protein of unknown function (DUF3618)